MLSARLAPQATAVRRAAATRRVATPASLPVAAPGIASRRPRRAATAVSAGKKGAKAAKDEPPPMTPVEEAAAVLSNVLDGELEFEDADYEQPAEVAAGPPAPFKLVAQAAGGMDVVLVGQFGTTEVTITVRADPEAMYFEPMDDDDFNGFDDDGEEEEEEEEEEDEDADDDEDEDDEDDGTEIDCVFKVEMRRKGRAGVLAFECEVIQEDEEEEGEGDADDAEAAAGEDEYGLGILSVALLPDGAADKGRYRPQFWQLNDELQDALGDYLSAHGLDSGLLHYLVGAQQDKEQTEYVAWLKAAKAWVA